MEDVFDDLVHVPLPDLRELDGDHEEGEAPRKVLPATHQVVREPEIAQVGEEAVRTTVAWNQNKGKFALNLAVTKMWILGKMQFSSEYISPPKKCLKS